MNQPEPATHATLRWRVADLDLVAGYTAGQRTAVWMNDGSGALTEDTAAAMSTSTSGDSVKAIVLGDIDGDNAVDMVLGIAGSPNKVYFNDGASSPTFTQGAFANHWDTTNHLMLADVDNDGKLDLISIAMSENRIYLNSGQRSAIFVDDTSNAFAVGRVNGLCGAVGDLDNDGDGTHRGVLHR